MRSKDEVTRIEALGSPNSRKMPRATKRHRKNRRMPPPATFDINPNSAFAGQTHNYLNNIDGQLLFRDTNHLTPFGSRYLISRIAPKLGINHRRSKASF
ncbi:MAG: hypothetical protein ABJA75_04105 [Bradyrhizobium sp.]